jgi:hypothetical protein
MSAWRRSLRAGAGLAVAGAASGGVVLLAGQSDGQAGAGTALYPVFGLLSALISGTALWQALVARHVTPSLIRGALVGGLTGVIAHPLCWYLMICWNRASIASGHTSPVAGDEPLGPLTGIPAAFLLSLASWLIVGWITVPAGAVVGLVNAGLARKASAKERETPA